MVAEAMRLSIKIIQQIVLDFKKSFVLLCRGIPSKTNMMPIQGQDLLNLVEQYPDASARNLAIRAGYILPTSGGRHCANLKGYYDALLDARKSKEKQATKIRRKDKDTHTLVVVHKSGNIVISGRHLGAKVQPGDRFRICPGKGEIKLERVS